MYLPNLRLHGDIEFLVDTGADVTSLMPDDMTKMGVDIQRVKGRYQKVDGVGGEAQYKKTRAILRFQDDESLGHFQEFAIDINPTRSKGGQQLPSLLGRDILNECLCSFDAVRERVTLKRLTSGD